VWSPYASPLTRRSGRCSDTGTGCSICRWSRATGLIFFTDGVLERNTASVDIEAMVAAGAEMHPREAVQHLIQTILQATGGALNDDATALCLDWHGGPVRERTTDSGANRSRGPGVDD
jgi:hypothetical protein